MGMKYKSIIFIAICSLVLFISSCFFTPKDHYLYVPLKDLISIIAMVWLAIIYGESNNIKNRKRIIVERFINDTLQILEENDLSIIDDDIQYRRVIILQRVVNNNLDLLSKHQEIFAYVDELKYCKVEFTKYWNSVSENNHNYKVLEANKSEYQSYLSNVSYRLKDILNKLYL